MADGGAISVPAMMAIGGAVAGGAMDKEQPLRGAALGAFGGYTGGAALGAAGAAGSGTAAGMGGSLGSGVTGGMISPAVTGAATGVGATGGITGGLAGNFANAAGAAAGQGGLLGGAGAGMAGMGAGISAPTSLLGMSAGEMAPSLSLAGHMGKLGTALENPAMGEKALSMGGQMLMKDQQAKQGQPVMPGVAPPMMKPNFAMPSFMQSAPNFRPVIAGLPQNRGVAANPRMRG